MKKRLVLIKAFIICLLLVSVTFFVSNVIAEDLNLDDNTYRIVYHSSCNMGFSTHNYNVPKNLSKHTCIKIGHTFQGWSKEKNGNVDYADEESVLNLTKIDNNTVILYAVWKPNTYTVRFNANGGEGTMDDIKVTYGEKTYLPKNTFTKEGYNFLGWARNDFLLLDHYDEQDFSKVAGKQDQIMELYAIWEKDKYSIEYNPNGQDVVLKDEIIDANTELTISLDIYKPTGYHIESWNTEPDGSGTSYKEGDKIKVTENIKLYAQWEVNEYTFRYHSTCEVPDTVLKYTDEVETRENTCEKEEYTFLGWSRVENTDTPTDFSLYPSMYFGGVNNNTVIDLYAVWQWDYVRINYDSNGGEGNEIDEVILNRGETFTTLKNHFTRKGYEFKNWINKNDSKEYEENTLITATEDITLSANWEPHKYTIRFNANGGEGTMEDQPMTYGISETLNENTFTKENHTLVGWSTEPNGDLLYKPNQRVHNLTTKDGETINLYAIWMLNEYYVEYYPNGGTGFVATDLVTHGKETTIKENEFIKIGYEYIGWNTKEDGTGTEYEPGTKISPTTDISLYAQWKKIGNIITFNPSGAQGVMENYAIKYNEEGILPTNKYVIPGYTFQGWSTTENGEVDYKDNETIKIEEDITLYAVWEANTYTVKFDANGGTGTMENQVLTYNVKEKLNARQFRKNDYIFISWNTKKDGTGKAYKNQAEVLNLITEGTITLYAQWKSNFSYEIKNYKVNEINKYIDQVPLHTSIDSHKKNIILGDGYSVSITSNNKNYIATGSKTKIYNSNQTFTYTNIVRGEVTGDGDIDFLDYVTVYNHISKTINPSSNKKLLTNEYLVAADMSLDGEVDFLDYVKIYNKIKELN